MLIPASIKDNKLDVGKVFMLGLDGQGLITPLPPARRSGKTLNDPPEDTHP
jgi:hypothetical protein